jgi:magnesium-transporting ATPase (P-type)
MAVLAVFMWAIGIFVGIRFRRFMISVICSFFPAVIGAFGFWYDLNEYVLSYAKEGAHQSPQFVVTILNSGLAFCIILSLVLILLTTVFRKLGER